MRSLRFWRFWFFALLFGFWATDVLDSAPEPEEKDMDLGVSILTSPVPFMGEQLGASPKATRSDDFEFPLGVPPPEVILGSPSGSTVGRAENPWNTRGRPKRGDAYD